MTNKKYKYFCEMCEIKTKKLFWNKQTQQNVCKECYRFWNSKDFNVISMSEEFTNLEKKNIGN